MPPVVRYSLLAASIAAAVLAAGFVFQARWATGLWPWPTSRLSNIFIASILAASAAPVFWIGLSGERAAITGGAVNLCVTNSGMAAYALLVRAADEPRNPIMIFGFVCAGFALLCLALALWARRFPFREARRSPALVVNRPTAC